MINSYSSKCLCLDILPWNLLFDSTYSMIIIKLKMYFSTVLLYFTTMNKLKDTDVQAKYKNNKRYVYLIKILTAANNILKK